jgi:anti-sigma regulatory factor (Ser/Thr protein kinase)
VITHNDKKTEYLNRLNRQYHSLISQIIAQTYSSDATSLNSLVKEHLFKEVLSDYLGFESASFFFYDEDAHNLMFFNEAVPDGGLEIPFFKIHEKKEDETFESANVEEEEFKFRRNRQKEARAQGDIPLTAQLCYDNLMAAGVDRHRWSTSEESYNWILIPEGEIVLFSFEYLLREQLERAGHKTKEDAISMIKGSSIAQEVWSNMHAYANHREMAGREHRSYAEALEWLTDVLESREEYKYLWDCSEEGKNWFIRCHKELKTLINSSSLDNLDNNLLRGIATFIIQYSHPYTENAAIDIGSARFYIRSRISPPLELLHGTHNIVMFLIRVYFPSGLMQLDVPIKVFLLGTFYDRKRCEGQRDKIRNIYSVLTTRDLLRYSMNKLAGSLKKVRKTEEILAALGGSQFVHELGKVGQIRWHTDRIKSEAEKHTFLGFIEKYLSRIETNVEKAVKVLKTSREMAELGFMPEGKIVNLSTVLPKMLEKLIKDVPVPDRVIVKKEIAESEVLTCINEYSIELTLENLIRNSVEAIQGKGRITVRYWQENGFVKLSVTDNGPGISEEVLGSMFDLFKSTKSEKLSGIGLYLCKSLIEAQDGSITGANVETGGAEFTITLKAVNTHEEQ